MKLEYAVRMDWLKTMVAFISRLCPTCRLCATAENPKRR